MTVEIFDEMGKLHKSEIVNRNSNIVIDISSLKTGIYFVKTLNQTTKILKTNE